MCCVVCFFFFKQKTAYEMRISDWSSDVCSSDLGRGYLLWRAIGALWRLRHGVADQRDAEGRCGAQPYEGPSLWRREHACGDAGDRIEIGRASCRERVCQYV